MVRAASLLMVGPIIDHNGLILCGVANSCRPGLSHVVETRLGQGAMELALRANKRVLLPVHTLHVALRGPRTRGCSGPRYCP